MKQHDQAFFHDLEWPLPNANPAEPSAYWTALLGGGPQCQREIGHRKGQRVYTTFDPQTRSGVAVAIEIGTREASFFAWAECEHDWIPDHQPERSVYSCAMCGHSYSIECEAA